MDLFELARTFQADREREIASTLRRRRLLAPTPTTRQGVTRDDRNRGANAGMATRVGQSVPSTRLTR